MKSKLHKNIKIIRRGGYPKVRAISVLPAVSGAEVYGFVNNNMENMLRAVNERVFYMQIDGQFVEPLQPSFQDIESILQPFVREFNKHVFKVEPIPLEDVPLLYTGRRRTRYEQSVESLLKQWITPNDARIAAFGKCEPYNLSAKDIYDIVMRVISPRSNRYCCALAMYIKAIEKIVYRIIDKIYNQHLPGQKSKTVIKGCNARQSAKQLKIKHDQFDEPVTKDADIKRMDQSTHYNMLSWEHLRYLPFFTKEHADRLRSLLGLQLVNKCSVATLDGFFKYLVEGGRMSGDMNTALGNCLIMCACFYVLFIKLGITKFAFINNGDDCTIMLELCDSHKLTDKVIKDHFKTLGYHIKLEAWNNVFEKIDFCRTRPVYTGREWIMVRDPYLQTSKDACCTKPFQTIEDFIVWMENVGKCGLSMSGGVPMLQEYYMCLIRNANNLKPKARTSKLNHKTDQMREDSGFKRLAAGMDMKYMPVLPEARASFYEAFGITPQLQIEIENMYKSYKFTWKGPEFKQTITRTPFHITERENTQTLF